MKYIKAIKPEIKKSIFLVAIVGVAVGMKVLLVWREAFPFNSDEAIIALMARHILNGELPIFFYGQAYMGSFDALLVAVGFRVFGEGVWLIRLVQILLFTGTLFTTYLIGKKYFGDWRIGAIAVVFMAFPTVNVMLYTTVSLGGYNEALLIGNLILLTGFDICKTMKSTKTIASWFKWLLLGLLVGFGLWVFGLTLIYAIPVIALLLYVFFQQFIFLGSRDDSKDELFYRGKTETLFPFTDSIKALLFFVLGGVMGAFPWLIYAYKNGISNLLFELGGKAISGAELAPFWLRSFQHLINFLLLGIPVIIGARPPWNVEWNFLLGIPFVLFFWIGVLVYAWKSTKYKDGYQLYKITILGICITLFLAFIFTPFGADPSGRYFVPLVVPMSLFAAEFIIVFSRKYKNLFVGIFVFVLFYDLVGVVTTATRYPPGITTQFDRVTQIDHRYDDKLITFLEENEEYYGFSNYWVSYPIAFLSRERIIYVPRLPYHLDMRYTSRDDRYNRYDMLVSQSPRVAYITTFHEPLNQLLRKQLLLENITWDEKIIGDYHIFYNLSRAITPEELGIMEFYR